MNDKEFKLVKLDKDNYVVWKWQFQNVLRAEKLTKVFTPGQEESDQSNQALALLGSALSEENILKIINCTKFIDAWTTIERCHENKMTYEPQELYRRLNSFKINTASEISSGLSEMQSIVAQLKNLNKTVSDNCLIGAILSAIPSCFDIFTIVWKNSSNNTVENLIAKLMAEAGEQSIEEREETKALVARRNEAKIRGSLEKDQCRYCKEKRHWIAECLNLKEPYDPGRNKKNRSKNQGSSNHEVTGNLAFVKKSPISYQALSKDIWVVDSGCTNHMTPYKDIFSSFSVDTKIYDVQLADNAGIVAAVQYRRSKAHSSK